MADGGTGLPGKREMARRWLADQELVRSLMPLLESALDRVPAGAARGEIEAAYAMVMERYKVAVEKAKEPGPRIVTARRRF